MLIWINGTFGVGKTTAAQQLVAARSGTRLFDPEWVGYLLTSHLRDRPVDDFQHLAAWRRLVPTVARELADLTGDDLVAVQTVLREPYWRELRTGLVAARFDVVHVVLDAEPDALRVRIDADAVDTAAAVWRHEHVEPYVAARNWLRADADVWVDTTVLGPAEVADAISAAIR